MISLEPELRSLGAPEAMLARERRDVFSVYPELRILGWLGATMLAAAAGIVLKNNLERIGPLALAVAIGIAAAACYAFVTWRRARASVVDDYVLLLGALLLSADVAFIESQFHLLDAQWKHHLLLLAIVHALGAYAYNSRLLLSLSITALASWFGVNRDNNADDLAIPAFITSAILIAWRELDRRFARTEFARTFEHFAATIALTGALTLTFHRDTLGAVLTVAIAAAVIAWGFRVGVEWFVLYAFVFAVIAIDVLLIDTFSSELAAALIVVVSMIVAIVALLRLHAKFEESRR
jgi:hypothetical protein